VLAATLSPPTPVTPPPTPTPPMPIFYPVAAFMMTRLFAEGGLLPERSNTNNYV